MRKITTAVSALGILSLASCSLPEKERKPVPPPSQTSNIPWNSPLAGQGGGMMGAMPKTPRR